MYEIRRNINNFIKPQVEWDQNRTKKYNQGINI